MDTHLDVHVAAADPIGGVLGIDSFATTPRGYPAMLEWMSGFGSLAKVGVEGTGAYGVGLGRFLRKNGIEVIEVDRPNRHADEREVGPRRRRRGGTGRVERPMHRRAQDPRRQRRGHPGPRRSQAVGPRGAFRAVHQMRQLSYTAPDQLRCRLKGLATTEFVTEAAALRVRAGGDPVVSATKMALASLGRRVHALEEEAAHLDERLAELVAATAPDLLELFGVGIDTVAVLLVAAGDNPERLRSEGAWRASLRRCAH